jgi:hypothetical protein
MVSPDIKPSEPEFAALEALDRDAEIILTHRKLIEEARAIIGTS